MPFGRLRAHQLLSLLPSWPLQACEFVVSGLSCPHALRILGFKVRNDPTSEAVLLQMGEVVQRKDLPGVTGQTQSLDQGTDVHCPAWGSSHCPRLFVPD